MGSLGGEGRVVGVGGEHHMIYGRVEEGAP